MNEELNRLASFGTDPLGPTPPIFRRWLIELLEKSDPELVKLLAIKNGFYACGGALHIYPAAFKIAHPEINAWNDPEEWRSQYPDLKEDPIIFFGQNSVGEQFGIKDGRIFRFEPETADLKEIANSLPEWVSLALGDQAEVGFQVLKDWERTGKILEPGKRLIPRVPIIAGGTFKPENLMAVPTEEAMSLRAEIWNQTKDLPEGTKIEIVLED